MTRVVIDPVTRIEGHLKIEVDLDGSNNVVDAYSSGTLFRGFEIILKNRDPRDATILTQRICGVCPIAHAMASSKNLDDAFDIPIPDNARIERNLVLGANFLMSHILHFYHLAALDYVKGPPMSPWTDPTGNNYPYDVLPSSTPSGEQGKTLVDHYVEALGIRKKAQEMAAIFGGKLPHSPTYVPGGFTERPDADKINQYSLHLAEVREFIDRAYIPDVLVVASAFPEYFGIGAGCGNLLAYGVFDLADGSKLLPMGRYTGGNTGSVNTEMITEHVLYSWYADSQPLNPTVGETVPDANASGAYSWLKAPRYNDEVHEVGPLARMVVAYLNNEVDENNVPRYQKVRDLVDGTLDVLNERIPGLNAGIPQLFSVLGREAARALECKYIADSIPGWLTELDVNGEVYSYQEKVANTTGMGLTEAPRGAIGHWSKIGNNKRIDKYQIITPTNWNASPRDDLDQPGPIEQALVGTHVADPDRPVELLRVIHSFDPCLSCAVHVITPDGDVKKFEIKQQ
jgi:hydrogenase large subunit